MTLLDATLAKASWFSMCKRGREEGNLTAIFVYYIYLSSQIRWWLDSNHISNRIHCRNVKNEVALNSGKTLKSDPAPFNWAPMNKQNFTSKFSHIWEEEKQNQSGKMNGGETETFRSRRRLTAVVDVLQRSRLFPENPHTVEDPFCLKTKQQHQWQPEQTRSSHQTPRVVSWTWTVGLKCLVVTTYLAYWAVFLEDVQCTDLVLTQ